MKKQLSIGSQVVFTPNKSKVDVYGEIVDFRGENVIIKSGSDSWIIPKERVLERQLSESEANVILQEKLVREIKKN